MELIQKGYSCEYDINIFINMFFSKEENVTILTDLSQKEEIISVYCEIFYEGKKYSNTYNFPFFKTEREDRKIKRNYVCSINKAFCKTAQKIKNVSLPWGVMSGIRPAKIVTKYKNAGFSYDEIKEILCSLYEVSPQKAELAITVSKNEEKILSQISENSVSIYIGIPFCPTRCLYCSFVSTDIKYSGKYIDDFVKLLIEEIKKTKEILQKCGFFAENIYIGGGTPTTLSPIQLDKLLSAVNQHLVCEKLKEFTLEAGRPDTIDEEKLSVIKKWGVNRISINPQTMNDNTLKEIGRCHTAHMTENAFNIARKCGFDNINTDIIAGLPGESGDDFKYTLKKVLEMNPENITIHSMCIKRSARLNRTDNKLTHSNLMNEMIDFAVKEMKKTSREPYYMYRQKNISGNLENVGYAVKGKESFYNVNIMEEAQTIIALGGGGATKLVLGERIERIFNFKDPYEYIRRFDEILDKKEEIARFYGKV